MSRSRTMLVALALAALALITAGGAAAKEGRGQGQRPDKPQRARITWSSPRIVQAVTPGQTVQVDVTLTSSADLANVTLRAPEALGRVLTIEPASFAELKAGVATSVRLTLAMPADGAHSQAGVVQVRAGQRQVPAGLKVKLAVPGVPDEGDSD